MSFLISALVGAACGVLSGFGIGGGTLLVLYMMSFTTLGQQAIHGINLIYFLPVSVLALISHLKNKLVDFRIAVPAIVSGVAATAAGALAATVLSAELLKKAFGVFLVCIGLRELLSKSEK